MKERDNSGLNVTVNWPDGHLAASVDLLALIERILERQSLIIRTLLFDRDARVAVQESLAFVVKDLEDIEKLYQAMKNSKRE